MDDALTLIATLQSAPRIIIGLVREMPPQNLKRPSPTKWSAHEHACHISTVDTAYLSRLELMLSDPEPYIKSMLPSADDRIPQLHRPVSRLPRVWLGASVVTVSMGVTQTSIRRTEGRVYYSVLLIPRRLILRG
jgi:hypothetical protein